MVLQQDIQPQATKTGNRLSQTSLTSSLVLTAMQLEAIMMESTGSNLTNSDPQLLGCTIRFFFLIRRFLCFREVNSDFLSTLYLHAFQVESPQGLRKASSLLKNAKPDQGLCEDMHITIIPGDLHRDTWSFNILQYLTSIAVQDGAGRNTEETCTTYNMMKIARYLFQWTGNARYADYYERAILNGMLGVQRMPANYTSKGTQTVSAGSVVISR